jgi:hypothetical protein
MIRAGLLFVLSCPSSLRSASNSNECSTLGRIKKSSNPLPPPPQKLTGDAVRQSRIKHGRDQGRNVVDHVLFPRASERASEPWSERRVRRNLLFGTAFPGWGPEDGRRAMTTFGVDGPRSVSLSFCGGCLLLLLLLLAVVVVVACCCLLLLAVVVVVVVACCCLLLLVVVACCCCCFGGCGFNTIISQPHLDDDDGVVVVVVVVVLGGLLFGRFENWGPHWTNLPLGPSRRPANNADLPPVSKQPIVMMCAQQQFHHHGFLLYIVDRAGGDQRIGPVRVAVIIGHRIKQVLATAITPCV